MTDPDSSRRTARIVLMQKRYQWGLAEHVRAVLALFSFVLLLLTNIAEWDNPHFSGAKRPKSVAGQCSEGISPIDF